MTRGGSQRHRKKINTVQLIVCGTQIAAYFEVYTVTHRVGKEHINVVIVQLRYRTPQTIVVGFCLLLYFTRRLGKTLILILSNLAKLGVP